MAAITSAIGKITQSKGKESSCAPMKRSIKVLGSTMNNTDKAKRNGQMVSLRAIMKAAIATGMASSSCTMAQLTRVNSP